MARFYFNVYDDMVATDDEGLELPNLDAARLTAVSGARDLMCSQLRHGYIVLSHRIDVVDDSGAIVLHLPFADAIEIRG
jgi:hypothetical protein